MIDNYGLWEQHDREEAIKERKLQVCDYCGEPIYERFLDLWGKKTCMACVESHYEWAEEQY